MSPVTVYVDSEFKALIPIFLASRQDDIAALRAALAENDYEKLRKIGHALRGVGSSYGFDFISEIGSNIKRAALDEDDNYIDNMIRTMEETLTDLEIIYEE